MILPIIEKCNQNCLFCSAEGRKDNLKKDFFQDVINQAENCLIISGGEPTLSPDLFWVIKRAKDRKLLVELQTNGITSYYKNLAVKIARLGVDLVNINFISHISSIDSKITQTKGLFNKKIKGIENLQALKINIRFTCIINSLNYKYLEDYVVFVAHNFSQVKYIQFSFIKIIGAAQKNTQIIVSYEKAQPFLLKAFKKCQKLNINFIVDHIPLCYLGDFKSYHIDYQKICQGEELKYSLREKVKIAECEYCSWSSHCCGIRKDYLEFFGRQIKVYPVK